MFQFIVPLDAETDSNQTESGKVFFNVREETKKIKVACNTDFLHTDFITDGVSRYMSSNRGDNYPTRGNSLGDYEIHYDADDIFILQKLSASLTAPTFFVHLYWAIFPVVSSLDPLDK